MDLKRQIHARDIFQYLTKKWWLPVTLVVGTEIFALLSSSFWHIVLGVNNPVGFALIGLSAFPLIGSFIIMPTVSLYQIFNRKYLLGLFNILMAIIIYLTIGYFSLAIT